MDFKPWETIDSTISQDQWKAWEPFRNKSCPPNAPYRTENTVDGRPSSACVEKPVDCPPGSYKFGPGTECRSGTPGGGGGGGGGGGSPFGPGVGMGQADTIWQAILARLNGASRYSPEALASLLGQVKGTAEAGATNQLDEMNADLAARGIARSGIAAEGARAIRAGVSANVLGAKTQLIKAKVDADYADKTAAIEEAQNWLNSLWQYTAGREDARASLTLAYARLQQEMDLMRERYAQELQLAGLGL